MTASLGLWVDISNWAEVTRVGVEAMGFSAEPDGRAGALYAYSFAGDGGSGPFPRSNRLDATRVTMAFAASGRYADECRTRWWADVRWFRPVPQVYPNPHSAPFLSLPWPPSPLLFTMPALPVGFSHTHRGLRTGVIAAACPRSARHFRHIQFPKKVHAVTLAILGLSWPEVNGMHVGSGALAVAPHRSAPSLASTGAPTPRRPDATVDQWLLPQRTLWSPYNKRERGTFTTNANIRCNAQVSRSTLHAYAHPPLTRGCRLSCLDCVRPASLLARVSFFLSRRGRGVSSCVLSVRKIRTESAILHDCRSFKKHGRWVKLWAGNCSARDEIDDRVGSIGLLAGNEVGPIEAGDRMRMAFFGVDLTYTHVLTNTHAM